MYKVNIHPSFCINGKGLLVDDLLEFGYSYIKEGEEFEKYIGEFILDWIDNSSKVTVHTSGSTGTPKTITLKKEQMINSALATGCYFNISSGDSALLCLPATYIAGKMMLVRAIVLGLDLYIVPPTSTPLNGIDKTFDFGAMVPLQALNSLSSLHQVKILIIGGASISSDLIDKLKAIDNNSFETYGMTETITHIAVKPLNKLNTSNVPFKTLPDVEISKDDRDCLVINSPKIAEEIVITNDVVELVSDNEFRWLGRYDNMINSGGIKLNPEQIESKLSDMLHQSFFISSLPDPKLGEQVVLILEGEVDKGNIMKHLIASKVLNKYELPRLIKAIPKFLRTDSDKIKRKETIALLKL